jgi:hypothetical protein
MGKITIADLNDVDSIAVSVNALVNLLEQKGIITSEEYKNEIQTLIDMAVQTSK